MKHAQYRKKDGKSTPHSSCSSLAEAPQESLDTGGAGWVLWHLNTGRISDSEPCSDGPKSCLPLALVIWLNYKSTASTFSSSNLIFCWSLRKSNSLISHRSIPLGIKDFSVHISVHVICNFKIPLSLEAQLNLITYLKGT